MTENSQAFGLTTGTKFGKNWGPDMSLIDIGGVSLGELASSACFFVNSISFNCLLSFFCNTCLKYTAHVFISFKPSLNCWNQQLP